MGKDLETFDAFQQIIARLRALDGCPWDREQTHASLKPYLAEEAYEVIEALDKKDPSKLCEELGDLLLQIGLHAQIAAESGDFEMPDILRQINEKLIRRHPHVFGDVEVSSSEEVLQNWEEIKKAENGDVQKSLLEGVPKDIPALAYRQIIQQRASRVGFDWPTIDGVLEKISEELEEIRQAETQQEKSDEFGDLLMALANAARWMNIDLENSLRRANNRFCQRFAHIEKLSQERGLSMNDMPIEKLDALWNEAKQALSE